MATLRQAPTLKGPLYTRPQSDQNRLTARFNRTYRRMARGECRVGSVGPIIATATGGNWTSQTRQSPSLGVFVAGSVPGNANFRAEGALMYGTGSPPIYSPYRLNIHATAAITQAVDYSVPWRMALGHYGRYLDVSQIGFGTTPEQRLWADGVCFQPNGIPSAVAADSLSHWITYDFGFLAFREIVIELSGASYGVRIGPSDFIQAPGGEEGPRVAIVGDSFVAGSSGVVHYVNAYPMHLAKMLGVPLLADFGYGGTGYVEPTLNRPENLYGSPTRLAELQTFNPSVIIVQGTLNDGDQVNVTATDQTMYSSALDYINKVRSQFPNATLIGYSGLVPGNWSTSALAPHFVGAQKQAFADAGVPYKDFSENFTGYGNVGNVEGNGIADYIKAADNIHPTDEGTPLVAALVAPHIAKNMGMAL